MLCHRYYFRTVLSSFQLAAVLLIFLLLKSPVWAISGYIQPDVKRISYRPQVPATILRSAHDRDKTRFYGEFVQGGRRFAVHIYDHVYRPVHSQRRFNSDDDISAGPRKSRLDVFLASTKGWKRTQVCEFHRDVWEASDPLTVMANWLWLEPQQKQTPLLFIQTKSNRNGDSNAYYSNIYGVLNGDASSKPFFCFNADIPTSMTTVYNSHFAPLDAAGRLTIVTFASDPTSTSSKAYGWTGMTWKIMGESASENYEGQSKIWNGQQFVLGGDS